MVATFNNPESTEKAIMLDHPDWKESFIENTIIPDEHRLQLCLLKEAFTILIASDGGVYNYERTFGVVISDGITQPAHNNGTFYSVDFCESSYWAELYAMLSGVLTFKK
jgi:hypothetical protein